MPVLIMCLVVVGSIALITYISIFMYTQWSENKYGPVGKDIDFEGARFRVLRYLYDKGTTVNRLSVIEDLEIEVAYFKQVINSLLRDKLVQVGPQAIDITTFGKQYHDVFLIGKDNNGSKATK